MQTKTVILSFLLLFSTTLLMAQSKYTVSGTVKQGSSGETLIGVTVTVVEKPTVGVITNEYGFYSISLPKGSYTLRFSYVGYKQELVPVKLESNATISVNLSDKADLQEVVISSKKDNDNLTKATMGTEVLDMKMAAKLPVVFGEKDL